MLLSSKITCRWVQCFKGLQNMKMKLRSNMKNFKELWAYLLEQVSNSVRGKVSVHSLSVRINGWKLEGRRKGRVCRSCDAEMR